MPAPDRRGSARVARRCGRSTAAAVALLLGAAPLAFGAPAAGGATALQQMVTACTVSMLNNVCSVSTGASAPPQPSPPGNVPVFVVGSGAVDPSAYAYLRDGGNAMCRRAQTACSSDWSGAVCKTARSLWSP